MTSTSLNSTRLNSTRLNFRPLPGSFIGWIIAVVVICASAPTLIRAFGIEAGPFAFIIPFTPYVAVAAVAVLGLALLSRSVVVSGIALVCAALQLAWVLPLFVASPASAAAAAGGGGELVVMTTNLLKGSGDAATVVSLASSHSVELLAVEELSADSRARLRDAGLDELLPYSTSDADLGSAGGRGTAIWSRYPLTPGVLEPGPVVSAHVEVPGLPLTFAAVHPSAPLSFDHPNWTRDQPILRAKLGSLSGPTIVAGDFNATLDHTIMQDLQADGFVDAAAATGSGISPTWPQGVHSPFALFAIDHVITRDVPLAAIDVQTAEVKPSDHRAVIAVYRFV